MKVITQNKIGLDKSKETIPSRCKECCHYNNRCTRIGESSHNRGIEGICWMEREEGEY